MKPFVETAIRRKAANAGVGFPDYFPFVYTRYLMLYPCPRITDVRSTTNNP